MTMIYATVESFDEELREVVNDVEGPFACAYPDVDRSKQHVHALLRARGCTVTAVWETEA